MQEDSGLLYVKELMMVFAFALMSVAGLLMLHGTKFGRIKRPWWAHWSKSVRMQRLGTKIATMCGVYGSLDFSDSAVLKKVKKFNMDKNAVKEVMFGGVQELMRNRNFYYRSSVGSNYSHWTDEGRQALSEYMDLMAGKMFEAEEAELDARAKKMVLDTLKGDE